jgi:small subunit ribosomal protein S6e
MADEIKCVISDTKTGKSYSKAVDNTTLSGRKINDTVPGNILGLTGYELKITGGSDNAGFPMRPEVPTTQRKKLLVQSSIGVKIKRKGMFKRKTIRGNTISPQTAQVNLSVAKQGTKTIQELLNPETKEETPKEDIKSEEKK